MLDFLKIQLSSIVLLWNNGCFTSWYAYLIYAMCVGPVFSVLKLDDIVWKFFSSFDTKYNIENYRIFNAFDVILDGTTWWLTLNELFFQPFLIEKFNWRFFSSLSMVLILKFIFGRKKPIKSGVPEPLLIKNLIIKFDYDPFKKDLSKNDSKSWSFFWLRENAFNIKNIFNDFFKWSYPNTQLMVLLSLTFFGERNVGFIPLLFCGLSWGMVSNRNWISDTLSTVFLLLFFRQIF